MHSANRNLASNYDKIIIISPFSSQCSPLSHCVKTLISEFPTYASFGGGGSHMPYSNLSHVLLHMLSDENVNFLSVEKKELKIWNITSVLTKVFKFMNKNELKASCKKVSY